MDKIGSTSSWQSTVNFATDGTGSGQVDYSDYSDFVLMVSDFVSQGSGKTDITWQFKRGSTWYDLAVAMTHYNSQKTATTAKFETVGLKQNAVYDNKYESFVHCTGRTVISSSMGSYTYSNQGEIVGVSDAPSGMNVITNTHNSTTAITGMRVEKTGLRNWKGIIRLYGMIAETT